MTDSVFLRRATATDAEIIASFNSEMALETEGRRLIPEVILAGVRSLIAHPFRGFYVVAEVDSKVVASLLVTTEWSDWRNGEFWWIQSVFVAPEFRRQGIYRKLYQFLKELAWKDAAGTDRTGAKPEPNDTELNRPSVCGFRLYVEKNNTQAQLAYTSLGMIPSGYEIYEELRPGVRYLQEDF